MGRGPLIWGSKFASTLTPLCLCPKSLELGRVDSSPEETLICHDYNQGVIWFKKFWSRLEGNVCRIVTKNGFESRRAITSSSAERNRKVNESLWSMELFRPRQQEWDWFHTHGLSYRGGRGQKYYNWNLDSLLSPQLLSSAVAAEARQKMEAEQVYYNQWDHLFVLNWLETMNEMMLSHTEGAC